MSLGARVKTSGELAGIGLSLIKQRDECKDDLSPEVELVQAQVSGIIYRLSTYPIVNLYGPPYQAQ